MLFLNLVGTAVAASLVGWYVYAYSEMWSRLAASYAGAAPKPPLAKKSVQQVVLVGKGLAFKRYVPLTVGIHETGISLAIVPPFSLSCPPVFLPFGEIRCRRTDWFLNGSSFAIRPERADLDVVVDDSLWSWIESNSELRLAPLAADGLESR